jgi:signal transduction histidine kinase/ligand-binding sensor domain-containing protein
LRGWTVLLSILACLTTPCDAAVGNVIVDRFVHRSWTSEQGAPAGLVAVAQTGDGYLWIASSEGVFRFDGLMFERIPPPGLDRFANAIPNTLFVDRRGNLWVGYNQNAGIATYRNGRLEDVPMPSPPPIITGFAETADHALWATWGGGSGTRLFRRWNGRWQSMDGIVGLPPGDIGSILTTADGTLWISLVKDLSSGKLLRLNQGETRLQTQSDRIGGTQLAEAPDGSLWISDLTGTRMVRELGGGKLRPPSSTRRYPPVPGASGPKLAFDRLGGIWGTTRGAGLFHLSPGGVGSVQRVGEQQRLTSNATIGIVSDREGSIWVATDGGLDRYRPAAVAHVPAVPADVVHGLYMARGVDGTVYVASSGAIYAAESAGPLRPIRTGLGEIGGLCPAAHGGAWVVHQGGVTHVGRGPSSTSSRPPGALVGAKCAEDVTGHLWIDLDDARWRRDQNGWSLSTSGPNSASLSDIVPDPGGGVIVNTEAQSLLRVTAAGSTVITADRLRVGPISTVFNIRGQIFAAGRDGLARVVGSQTQHLGTAANPWLAGVRGMALGADGAYWLLVRLGIVRVSGDDLAKAFATSGMALRHRLFDSHDGFAGRAQLVSFRGTQMAVGGDGRVWFLSRAGVMTIRPMELGRNGLAPPVTISSVSADGRQWRDPDGALRLPAGTHALRIGFAVNSLLVPDRNRVLYRLEGQDADWVRSGARREVNYTNLSPGSYAFRVIAANGDGVWNRRGATLVIDIPPTFQQGMLFKLICLTVAAFLLWLAYLARLRVVTRRVRARMLDRLRERERIARDIHDTLLQSIHGLMLRFQVAMDTLPPEARSRSELEQAMDRADDVVAEGRDRLRDLRLTAGRENAENALKELVARQLWGTGIVAVVRSEGTVRTIDPLVWDELAGIAAEMLFNAARHSQCTEVTATLRYRSSRLGLIILDNGIGIEPSIALEGRPGHYGIPGVRERAAQIGATAQIGPMHEGGTEAAFFVPGTTAYSKPRPSFLRSIGSAIAKVRHGRVD